MFQQLLEELRKVREEMASKINGAKKLQEEVNRLTAENEALKEEIANHVCEVCDHSALEQEIADLKQQIADHVCPTCNHEEEITGLNAEIEVLNQELVSIKAENDQLKTEHEENVKALQAEIDALKKILATS